MTMNADEDLNAQRYPDDLQAAIDAADFSDLLLCHEPEYEGSTSVSIEEIEAAARDNGLLDRLEHDKEIAALKFETIQLLNDASDRIGVDYSYSRGRISFLKPQKGKTPPITVQISSPLAICGVGYLGDDTNPVLHIKVLTETLVWKDYYSPRKNIVAKTDFYAELASIGIRTAYPAQLVSLLNVVEPKRHFRCYDHVGWHGDDFVLHDGTVITKTERNFEVRCNFETDARFTPAGDKTKADQMLKAVEGDDYIVSACAMILFAPVVPYLELPEPGGIHYFGNSTTGKTTTLIVAASLMGRGAPHKVEGGGVLYSWNGTAFIIEKNIGRNPDHAVLLDEAQQLQKMDDLSRIIYSVNQGESKSAGNGHRGDRKVFALRSPILSTGELSLQEMIESDKKLGKQYGGGAALRILDVPFNGLKSIPDDYENPGAFADHLRDTARQHYGHHFPKLVRLLVDDRDAAIERVKELADSALPEESNSQLRRVQKRFALMAAVVELAIERGVLPWKPGTGNRALRQVFEDWKESRGGDGTHEQNRVLETFTSFIFKNKSRIHYLNVGSVEMPNRLAIQCKDTLYFTKDGLEEACGGKKEADNLINLLSLGHSDQWGIKLGSQHNGKPRRQIDVPKEVKAHGCPSRMYAIIDKHYDLACDPDAAAAPPDRPAMPASRRR